MTTPTKEAIRVIAEHPKTSAVLLAVTGIETFWIEWGNWVVDACYSVCSLALVCVLLRNALHKDKKGKTKKGGVK